MSEVDLGGSALWTLLPLSAASTMGALFVLRRLSDRKAIVRVKNHIVAHLLELALFLDEPLLVLRAQRDLIRENLRLLRLILLPCTLLVLPFAALLFAFEGIYGRAPLVIGAPAIVTLRLPDAGPAPRLSAPAGIDVETPAVRIISARQFAWRVRPVHSTAGRIDVFLDHRVLSRRVWAGPGRIHSFEFPGLGPSLEISYPRATILHIGWPVWFIFASLMTAFLSSLR